jgi:hypothetical protein
MSVAVIACFLESFDFRFHKVLVPHCVVHSDLCVSQLAKASADTQLMNGGKTAIGLLLGEERNEGLCHSGWCLWGFHHKGNIDLWAIK